MSPCGNVAKGVGWGGNVAWVAVSPCKGRDLGGNVAGGKVLHASSCLVPWTLD